MMDLCDEQQEVAVDCLIEIASQNHYSGARAKAQKALSFLGISWTRDEKPRPTVLSFDDAKRAKDLDVWNNVGSKP